MPPPGVAGSGHPTRRGPDGGVPWGWRNPTVPSLSLSPPQVPCRRVPRAQPRWRGGPAPGGRRPQEPTAGRQGRPARAPLLVPFPQFSPRQFLVPLPRKPGPACWRCGDPGHFIDRCPVMEVGTLVAVVPDVPQAAPRSGWGVVPDTCEYEGGVRIGLWWIRGCNQTSIHQSLVQPEALDMSCMVRVRCVHGDVAEYPVVRFSHPISGTKA